MSPSEPRVITKDFVLLVIAHFMQALGYASMLLLPLYLAHLGANRTQIGAVMAAGSVGGLAMRPLIGAALDTMGRKRTLYLGTVATAAGMGLFLAIDSLGPLIYLDRILIGVGTGTLFTGYFALVSDLIPAERRTQGIALFGISGLVPLMVNPASETMGLAPPDLRWFFPALGGVVFLSMLPLAGVKEPGRPNVEKLTLHGALDALKAPALRPSWVGGLMFSGVVSTFMTFATVAAAQRGLPRPADLWFAYAAGAVLVRLFGGRVLDRVGPSRLFPFAMLGLASAAMGAAAATSAVGFFAAALLGGMGHGLGFPVLTSQLVTRVPPAFRGSGLATLTAVWEVGALTSAPVFGAIADASSDARMFQCAAAAVLVGLLMWWPLERAATKASG